VVQAGCYAVLQVQSSTSPASAAFVRTPSVMVLAAAQDWDAAAVRRALATAAGKLWTTSQLGAAWVPGAIGRHQVEQLDGLGKLIVTAQGKLLFLASDADLLATVLDHSGAPQPAGPLTYAAGFRHLRERARYERLMTALDSNSSGVQTFQDMNHPPFFSANLGSLSRTLSRIVEVRITAQEQEGVTRQTVVYQTAQ